MFKKLVSESNGNYSKYIIMPTNLAGVASIIKTLPKQNVYILDQTKNDLNDFPSVHQNFSKDIYAGLEKGKSLLSKYKKLILIFPGNKEPLGMVDGFDKFCSANLFENKSYQVLKKSQYTKAMFILFRQTGIW